ncbi:MAG: zinc-binding dehydrogenase [Olsenella sp.]|jgi:NADPH2:quinone reductase
MDLPANGYLTSFCSGNVDQARIQALFDEIARTHADLGPAKVFPFSELREAHAWLGSKKSVGKAAVVL